jgi:hypothetical protein
MLEVLIVSSLMKNCLPLFAAGGTGGEETSQEKLGFSSLRGAMGASFFLYYTSLFWHKEDGATTY